MLLVFADTALRVLSGRVEAARLRVSAAAYAEGAGQGGGDKAVVKATLDEALGALHALRRSFGLPEDYLPTRAELLDVERGE